MTFGDEIGPQQRLLRALHLVYTCTGELGENAAPAPTEETISSWREAYRAKESFLLSIARRDERIHHWAQVGHWAIADAVASLQQTARI